MNGSFKYQRSFLPGIILFAIFTTSCENDLNKVRAIAAADATKPIERTTGVEMIYSDSAKVKVKLNTPLLLDYKTKTPYSEMPKGVLVTFYNSNLQEEGTVVADSSVVTNNRTIIEFYKNVVAKNPEGSVFKSEELIYDRTKKEVYSKRQVTMTKVNGDVLTGTSFKSDQAFKHPVFQNSTAVIHVNNSVVP